MTATALRLGLRRVTLVLGCVALGEAQERADLEPEGEPPGATVAGPERGLAEDR